MPRKQSSLRAIHRVQRRNATTRSVQFLQAVDERRFERANIEDKAPRLEYRELCQNSAGYRERRRDDNDIIIYPRICPALEASRPVLNTRVSDGRRKTLRREEIGEPAAHLASTTDDENPSPVPGTFCDDALTLLAGQRRPNKLSQDTFGEIRINPQLFGLRAPHFKHILFPREVARPPTCRLFAAADFRDNSLTLGDKAYKPFVNSG